MRLQELINFEPKDSVKNYHARVNNTRVAKSDELGSGHFARAVKYDSPKRINQVRKQGRAGRVGDPENGPKLSQKIEDDAYLSYIKMIYDFEQKGGNNPFFPKIHGLKIFRDKTGNLDYAVDMEELVELTSPRIAGNLNLMNQLYQKFFKVKDPDYDSYTIIVSMIQTRLKEIANDGDYDSFADPKLIQAMSMARDLGMKHGFEWDIHSGNMMWRITGNIPQLVLTDILA